AVHGRPVAFPGDRRVVEAGEARGPGRARRAHLLLRLRGVAVLVAERDADLAERVELELVDVAERAAIADVAFARVDDVLLVGVVVALEVELEAALAEVERLQG